MSRTPLWHTNISTATLPPYQPQGQHYPSYDWSVLRFKLSSYGGGNEVHGRNWGWIGDGYDWWLGRRVASLVAACSMVALVCVCSEVDISGGKEIAILVWGLPMHTPVKKIKLSAFLFVLWLVHGVDVSAISELLLWLMKLLSHVLLLCLELFFRSFLGFWRDSCRWVCWRWVQSI